LISSSSNINISENLVSSNANWGFLIFYLNDSIISRNSITYNLGKGFDLYDSFDNRIVENNFIENGPEIAPLWNYLYGNVGFVYSMFPKRPYNNTWDKNFWDKGRILPKLVFGVYRFSPSGVLEFPWIDFDWHPAKEPYDIPIVEGAL
jgi:parallel beta-helix repeat protein